MAETNGKNVGKVVQVIGSTLDAEFAEEHLPNLYNALKVDVERKVLGMTTKDTLWCEVAQHLGGGNVRAVALGTTDGVVRGSPILDTGGPVTCAVRCTQRNVARSTRTRPSSPTLPPRAR